jgi:hypothetical protein
MKVPELFSQAFGKKNPGSLCQYCNLNFGDHRKVSVCGES